MSARYLACPLLAIALLAGCSQSGDGMFASGSTSIDNGAIDVRGDHVTLNPDNAPKATIDNTGSFSVNGKPVAVNDAQRALLKRYYDAASAVRQHGIETGKAGASVAGESIKGAVSSIVGGDDKSIGDKVQAQTEKVTQAAMKICADLAGIRVAQDQLAAQLDAFKPYGQLITTGSVDECRNDGKN